MAPMTIPGSEASLFFYPDNPPPNSGSGIITKEKRQGTVNCSKVVWEEKNSSNSLLTFFPGELTSDLSNASVLTEGQYT